MVEPRDRLNVIIAIGGSGIRVAEAIVHLAAAGFFTTNDKLYILFVDPDINNANLTRTFSVLEEYRNIRGKLNYTDRLPIFAADIDFISSIFNPLEGINRTLDDTFRLQRNDLSNLLAHSLYANEELTADLEVGFRGRPPIGSAVFLRSVSTEDVKSEEWKTLKNMIRIHLDAHPRIILIGSVFGGTGASGLPTLSYDLRKEFGKDIKIAGIFLLPYFKFKDENSNEIFAHSASFAYKTLYSLLYYGHAGFDRVFDHIYLIGSKKLFEFPRFSLGGEEQANPLTIVDLIAATAVKDFIWRDFKKDPGSKVSIFRARVNGSKFVLSSISVDGDKGKNMRPVAFINLFVIFSLFLIAFFIQGPGSIGYKIFKLKYDDLHKSSLIFGNLFVYLKYYFAFISEVVRTAADSGWISDILINEMNDLINYAGEILNNRSKIAQDSYNDSISQDYYSFLREYRELLGPLNRYVANAMASYFFKNEAEFVLSAYSYTSYFIYELIRKKIYKDGKWEDWVKIFTANVLVFILQITKFFINVNINIETNNQESGG